MISIFESLASGDNPPKLDSDDSSDDSDEDSHVDEDDNDEEAMAYEEEEEGILDKADLEADELSRPRSRVVHRKIKATVLGNYCCFCSRLCFHKVWFLTFGLNLGTRIGPKTATARTAHARLAAQAETGVAKEMG